VKDEGLQSDKEERNIQNAVKRRTANLICLIFLRKCLLKHVIEGNIEGSIEEKGR
jgi:hypothetical protein